MPSNSSFKPSHLNQCYINLIGPNSSNWRSTHHYLRLGRFYSKETRKGEEDQSPISHKPSIQQKEITMSGIESSLRL